MKFEPINIKLKDSEEVVIRMAQVADADALNESVKTYLDDSEFLPLRSDEFTSTRAEQEARIKGYLEQHNSLLLVAEYNGKIVGNIDFTGSQRKAMQHTTYVGMGMLREWRNKGLGTALMQLALFWAKANPVLEIVWLQVYAGNTAAISMYRKMGFKDSGVQERFFKTGTGYDDNLIMTLYLR